MLDCMCGHPASEHGGITGSSECMGDVGEGYASCPCGKYRPNMPPASIIAMAVGCAARSLCAKSKRGVVVFADVPDRGGPLVFGYGDNHLPWPWRCDGTEMCRRDCAKVCVHAETHALRYINRKPWPLYLLHVKAVDGVAVPGGPPSCWQCSREIADRAVDDGIAGVWLFEDRSPPEWRLYTPEEFHEATLANCELYGRKVF